MEQYKLIGNHIPFGKSLCSLPVPQQHFMESKIITTSSGFPPACGKPTNFLTIKAHGGSKYHWYIVAQIKWLKD